MPNNTFVDLVKITALNTGSGAFVLGPAVAGFRGIEALTNGAPYGYSVQQGSKFEVGRGTFSTGDNTLTRGVLYSSDGASPINLGPNAQVTFCALAEDFSTATDPTAELVAILASAAGLATIGAAAGGTAQAALDNKAPASPTFSGIGSIAVGSARALWTSGYTTAGVGAALYVADSLATSALLAAHPRACKKSLDNVIFRLAPVGFEIRTSQCGSVGAAGTDDRPAIQAALYYAAAVSVAAVRIDHANFDVRSSAKTTASFSLTADGHGLVVPPRIALLGLPGRGSKMRHLQSDGSLNSAAAVQSTTDSQPWRGNCVRFLGGTSLDWNLIADIEIDGTYGEYTFGGGSNPSVDLSQKGIALQDVNLARLFYRDIYVHHVGGETIYQGGAGLGAAHLERVKTFSSPQCGFNPGTSAAVTARDCDFDQAYQPMEMLIGANSYFENVRFGKGYSVTINPAGQTGGYPYNYPFPNGRPAGVVPMLTFGPGVVFECNSVMNGFVRGRYRQIDATTSIYTFGINAQDIDLEVDDVCDYNGNSFAVTIYGPTSHNTIQIAGAPTGKFYQQLQTTSIKVNLTRTQSAVANGRARSGIVFQPDGVYDQASCKFHVSGEGRVAWGIGTGTIPSGWKLPLITLGAWTPIAQPLGGQFVTATVGGTTTVECTATAMVFDPASNGSCAIVMGTAVKPANGQEIVIYQNNNSGNRPLTIAARAGNMQGPRSRRLTYTGDFVRYRYTDNSFGGAWREIGYAVLSPQRVVATLTVTPANLAAGAQVVLGSVSGVTDLAQGDVNVGCSAVLASNGNSAEAGVELWARASGSGVATFYARADPGAAWNPGASLIVSAVFDKL